MRSDQVMASGSLKVLVAGATPGILSAGERARDD
jgi:hypothetical protein